MDSTSRILKSRFHKVVTIAGVPHDCISRSSLNLNRRKLNAFLLFRFRNHDNFDFSDCYDQMVPFCIDDLRPLGDSDLTIV